MGAREVQLVKLGFVRNRRHPSSSVDIERAGTGLQYARKVNRRAYAEASGERRASLDDVERSRRFFVEPEKVMEPDGESGVT